MSNYPLLPNTTQIPNVVLDQWMPHLSHAELRIVLYVARRTYGFGKEADAISLKQMCDGITKKDGTVLDEGTGLSRSGVIKACASLEAKGVLMKVRKESCRGSEPSEFRLNLLRQPFEGGSTKYTPPSTKNTGGVHKIDPQNQVLQNQDTQVVANAPTCDEPPQTAASSPEENQAVKKKNWFTVLCDRFEEVGLGVSEEDRGRLPGNLVRCQVQRDATDAEMYRLIGHLVERRLAGYVLSPQECLNDVRGYGRSSSPNGSLNGNGKPKTDSSPQEEDPWLAQLASWAEAQGVR